MALITCPECGKEISSKASACIHCGCPINNETLKKSSNNSVSDFVTKTNEKSGAEFVKTKIQDGTINNNANNVTVGQKQCPMCKKWIPNDAKICGFCRSNQPGNDTEIILCMIFGFLVLSFWIGCLSAS